MKTIIFHLLVIKDNNYAIVSYQFQFDNIQTSSKRRLKFARLLTINPFKQPELNWKFTLCQTDCQQEFETIP